MRADELAIGDWFTIKRYPGCVFERVVLEKYSELAENEYRVLIKQVGFIKGNSVNFIEPYIEVEPYKLNFVTLMRNP
ncbi:MAG TPA: hypothetical protein PKD34_03455 [Candidatus Doudnabacteria bacterium]|nr:hypothetical protein [Candidatus Doudnabacteria bacterium]